MKCLKCEKILEFIWPDSDATNVGDGGDMDVTFHYGSRHDMCQGFLPERKVRAYICDDCFDKYRELFAERKGAG